MSRQDWRQHLPRTPSLLTSALPALALLVLTLAAPAPVSAHGGEDHSHEAAAAAPALPVALAPRFEATSPAFQLLGILENGRLTLYLDRFADNAPVAGATLTVEVDGRTQPAPETGAATYGLAETGALANPGTHELLVSVTAGDEQDVLIGTLSVPPAAASGAAAPAAAGGIGGIGGPGWGLAGLALLLGYGLGRLGRRTAPASPLLIAGVLGLGLALAALPPAAHAHGGEDHGHDEAAPLPATLTGDAPRRLPDGSVFVPKPVGRLLGLRTQLAAMATLAQTVVVPGHLIADPNRSGRVQAPQAGRIVPAAGGIAHLGQPVRAGEVLAWLEPLAASLEAAGQSAGLAELDSQIELATQRLTRLQQLAGSVAQREIDEARTELAGLRKRRSALGTGLGGREPLRAPVDGVVSRSTLVAGQIVEARETLVEILDPGAWWVEAVVFDAGLAGNIDAALAETDNGRTYRLGFLGMGFERRAQGLPMQWRVDGDGRGLSAGQPVRLLLQTRSRSRGVPLPVAALVRGADGESRVWVQAGIERFVPRRVQVQPLDGERVLVTGGLADGERFLVIGASLLAQLR